MRIVKPVRSPDIYIGRLACGADLLEELTAICREKDVRAGRIEALGAVRRARLACYDQSARAYEHFEIDRPLEITNLTGNVSLKGGEPFVHAHITLADESGASLGGHLASGTEVFACEFVIESFEGAPLERRLDPETGLPLWADSEEEQTE